MFTAKREEMNLTDSVTMVVESLKQALQILFNCEIRFTRLNIKAGKIRKTKVNEHLTVHERAVAVIGDFTRLSHNRNVVVEGATAVASFAIRKSHPAFWYIDAPVDVRLHNYGPGRITYVAYWDNVLDTQFPSVRIIEGTEPKEWCVGRTLADRTTEPFTT